MTLRQDDSTNIHATDTSDNTDAILSNVAHQQRRQTQPNTPPHRHAWSSSSSSCSTNTPERLRNLDSVLTSFCRDDYNLGKSTAELRAWHLQLDLALDPAYRGKQEVTVSFGRATVLRRSKRAKYAPLALPHSSSGEDNDKTDTNSALAPRLGKLTQFLQDEYFEQLSTDQVIFKHLVEPQSLLLQLDKLKCHTHTTGRKQRIQTLLEHTFVHKTAARTVDHSLFSEHSTASDFTRTFNGPGLMLLQDHLIVHNALFPITQLPAPVHAAADASINDDDHDDNDDDVASTKRHEYYAKVLPILQSSGFGKTRMCVQLSTRHPGMLVCLRNSRGQDQHLVSFPPQDASVYHYFRNITSAVAQLHTPEGHLKVPEDADEHRVFNRAHLGIVAWLGAYYKTLFHYLDQLKTDSGSFNQQQRSGTASGRHDPESCWHTVINSFAQATSFNQRELFQIPEGLCGNSCLALTKTTNILTTATTTSASGSGSSSSSSSSSSDQSTAEATTAVRPAADLAPPLLTGTSNLCNRILDHICTSVTLHYKEMLKKYDSILHDNDMLIGAIGRYLKGSIDALENLSPKHNLLALASRRIPLELTSKAGPDKWYAFVSQQIAHHLRFVGRIYSTSDTIILSTPSEPSLSAAAAWYFRSDNVHTTAAWWASVVQVMVNALAPVGIDIGAQGEQGVALVCSMALDLAVSKWYRLILSQSLTGTTMMRNQAEYDAVFGLVMVREWLDMLIGSAPRITREDHVVAAKHHSCQRLEPSDDEGPRCQGMPPHMANWADRAWLNFKHVVRLANQVPHDVKVIGPEVLVELWFRHATTQGIINQPGWDFLIPIYETDDANAPMGSQVFDKDRLSYVAIQVKNCIQRPDATTLKANVGPRLGVANGRVKHCLELLIILRAPGNCCVYTQRPSLVTMLTLPEQEQEPAQGLVRHHMLMGGSALCVLDRLTGLAKNQAGMLFGNADSLDTLKFDDKHAKYIRQVKDRNEHQSAWKDVQMHVQGALVGVTRQLSGMNDQKD
ncbi:uncharacterized protein SPSC_00009 [Sporisorium scitamineum]|uniref:Uncharacterized protein n=1 Tax=Sporisorium scitamineum TaxID=49012 RepID=A0A140KLV8_9BASI|nr:uncharacterized protein SPSC_00009 [Sporisorium scitamineum]